jgi:hypothetical protein
MPRIATWNEVAAAYRAYDKLETFNIVRDVAQAFFDRNGRQPARVELEVEIGSEYDDEGGAFTTVSITKLIVTDAAGTRLEAFDPETRKPLEDDDEPKERLIGSEWDIRKHFFTTEDRCVIDLLEPPPAPPDLFVIGDAKHDPERT